MNRFLLVDDDALFRESLSRALERRSYEVMQAASVQDAIDCLETFHPDAVSLDLRMPGALGLELIPFLVERFGGVRIVVLTGYGSIATAVQAIRLGAYNYVTKPVDVDTLLAAFQTEPEQRLPISLEGPSLSEREWETIHAVLHDCDGNISQAAKQLGIHRRSLQRKLRRNE